MGATNRNVIWDRGLGVLNTVRDAVTNTILAMLGDEVAGASDSDDAEWWQHIGFASRPSKPEAGKAGPQVVVLRGSDHDACIASRDVRCHGLYGSLNYGETCIYAGGEDGTGQARVLLKADGGIHLYTRKGNTPSGVGMMVQLDAQNGAIRLVNDLGYGIIIDADGVKITAGGAGITLAGSGGGIKVIGTGEVQVDGGKVVIGSMVVPVVNNALRGLGGVAGACVASPSSKVFIE